MSTNRHAAAMAEYEKDAAETDKPWLRWECVDDDGDVYPLDGHPVWNDKADYRRKPPTIRIGKFDVPEPMRVAPAEGSEYWVAHLLGKPPRWFWQSDEKDREWLKNGICHATKQAAELHARALISLTAEGGE